ncbi:hypothetical protein ACJX0J_008056, partial [Zea mays]
YTALDACPPESRLSMNDMCCLLCSGAYLHLHGREDSQRLNFTLLYIRRFLPVFWLNYINLYSLFGSWFNKIPSFLSPASDFGVIMSYWDATWFGVLHFERIWFVFSCLHICLLNYHFLRLSDWIATLGAIYGMTSLFL